MASDSVKHGIVIAADLPTIFEIIADFDSYPGWQDAFKAAETLETGPDGWGTRARYTIEQMGLSETFELAYTYTDTSMSWRLVEGHRIKRLDGTYTITELDDGTCRLTYELETETSLPLPSFARRKIADKIVHDGLHGVKRRAEGS